MFFLDADDDIAEGFIEKRWQAASASQADVMIFNGWHSGADHHQRAVHRQQRYGTTLSGHEWIRHCVTHREWPHYLWLQMVRSPYIRKHSLCFQPGKSHKDILWTVHLAASNGRFCILDVRDYIYISNITSITHRSDYYDVRAKSYVEVIAEIIHVAEQEQNKKIKVFCTDMRWWRPVTFWDFTERKFGASHLWHSTSKQTFPKATLPKA